MTTTNDLAEQAASTQREFEQAETAYEQAETAYEQAVEDRTAYEQAVGDRAAVALALAESLAYAATSGWATPVSEFETKGVARFEELDARVEATAKALHDAARKAECAAEKLRRDGVPL